MNPPPPTFEPQGKSQPRRLIEMALSIVVAVGIAFLIQQFFFKPYKIPSESMVPTLIQGQRVIVDKISPRGNHPKLNDVVVFHPPPGVKAAALVDQCARRPSKNSACALSYPGQLQETFIKRIIGMPGDRIAMNRGRVIRNGQATDEPFISNSCSDNRPGCSWTKPVVVPDGYYYLLGDNRGLSDDSRFWGPLNKEAIVGRAVVSYWPIGRLGRLR